MVQGKKRINDEHLSNGSIIFWSRRFAEDGRYYVPVRCGDCGEERVINAVGAQPDFTGLCPDCAHFRRRKVSLTIPQTLPNGSIIYWNEEHIEDGTRMVPVRCGGLFCGGSIRVVPVYTTYAENFTGQCRQCAHAYDRSGTWTGGRKKSRAGYILVKLPPNHPFFSMAHKSDGHVLEHRLVVAESIGRPLRDDEIVHHINGKKDNNRLENLQLFARHEYHFGYQPAGVEEGGRG